MNRTIYIFMMIVVLIGNSTKLMAENCDNCCSLSVGLYSEPTQYQKNYISGFYSTAQEAAAARDGYSCGGDAAFDSDPAGGFALCPQYGYYTRSCLRDEGGGVWWYDNYQFLHSETCCVPCAPEDSDEDGLPDTCDPFPQDDSEFSWQEYGQKRDVNGDVYYSILKVYKDGEMSYYTMGENDENDSYVYVPVDQSLKGVDEWFNSICDNENFEQDISGASNDEYIGIDQDQTEIQTDDGINNNSTSTIETDYLQDIVQNTQAIADNQGSIGEVLAGISDKMDDTNRLLSEDTDNSLISGDTEYNGPTASEIGSSVASEIQSDRDAEGQEGIDDATSEEASWDDPTNNFDGDVSGDVPEKNLIADIYNGFLSNNPVSQYINDSGVQCTGDCSMTWEWKGKQIDFTICSFADELQIWGAVLMGLTGLISLMVVIKR